MEEVELPAVTKLFVSENLNSYYRELGWLCRRLKR